MSPDTFNGLEAPFPGLVTSRQGGPRWLVTGALVSNFGSSVTNVFRVGKQWAPVAFLLESEPTENFIDFQGITDPWSGDNFQSQGRDTQVWQISDNVSWSKGNHLFRFGGDYQQIFADTFNDVGINPRIVLGTPAHNTGDISDSEFSVLEREHKNIGPQRIREYRRKPVECLCYIERYVLRPPALFLALPGQGCSSKETSRCTSWINGVRRVI